MINRREFFDALRGGLFSRGLSQEQVNGIEDLIDVFEERQLTDIRLLAYVLATVHHETGKTFEPVREYGRGKGHKYGEVYPPTGQVYYGRGYPQLTWFRNYKRMGKLLGIDLVNTPDLALDPKISAQITWEGMLNGRFTGAKLTKYISGRKRDYIDARRTINGQDCASKIAALAVRYETALENNWTAPKPKPKSPKDMTIHSPRVVGASTAGLVAAGHQLQSYAQDLSALSSASEYIQYGVIGIGVLGALMTAYAIIRKNRKAN